MTDLTLTGDSTHAAIVFSPKVPGVEQVEVVLPFAEGEGERTFTPDDHDRAEAYARVLLAAPDMFEALRDILTAGSIGTMADAIARARPILAKAIEANDVAAS